VGVQASRRSRIERSLGSWKEGLTDPDQVVTTGMARPMGPPGGTGGGQDWGTGARGTILVRPEQGLVEACLMSSGLTTSEARGHHDGHGESGQCACTGRKMTGR